MKFSCATAQQKKTGSSATQKRWRETLALARAGDYRRIFDAMDYRDNDLMVLRAEKGAVEASDALATLARTWAELNAEVTE